MAEFSKDGGRLEMEFLVESANGVVPVEVKAKTGATLSLDKLLADPSIPCGYKSSRAAMSASSGRRSRFRTTWRCSSARWTEFSARTHYVPAEMFDVSKAVRGEGVCEVACAAIEKRFSTPAKKHFFGLRTPVPFAVEIPIGGDATEFTASCGVDAAGAKGKVRLKVLGDGRELWSGVVSSDDTADLKARADVRGVKTLTLAADPADGASGAGAVWGGAKLLYADGKALPNDVRRTSRQLGILTPPERPEPRVNGPRVYGVRPGRPVLFRVPATGAAPLRVEVLGLDAPNLAGLSYDPKTRILSGHVDEPGEYALAIRATNRLGSDEKPLALKVGETICLTPAMGWSSWNAFGGAVSDEKMRAAADALVTTGLADHGYAYVNVDDFWQNIPERAKDDPSLDGPLRDADGRLAPNSRFPDMKALADFIHARGLKAGIYSSPGLFTCGRAAGSWGHEELSPFTRSLLTNDEVIEIDQDPLGKAAGCIDEGDDWEVWARPLADGSIAAGLYNKSGRERMVSFDLRKAGLLCKWLVRDVWRQEDVGVFAGAYDASVPGHATHLVRLRPCRCGKLREDVTDIRDAAWRLLREKDLACAAGANE